MTVTTTTTSTTTARAPRPVPDLLTRLGRSARSEAHRLTRRRTLLPATLAALAAGAAVTAALLLTLPEHRPGPGLSLAALEAGHGLVLVPLDALGYGAIVIFTAVVVLAAGGYRAGSTRTGLLHQPDRTSLALGQAAARGALLCGLVLLATLAGMLTTLALAPGLDIDTAAWATADGLRESGQRVLVLVGYVAGWVVLGTTLGHLVRTVGTALLVGLVWTGPVENILGDDWELAQRWFPGLLLRSLLVDDPAVGHGRALVTLAAYAVVCAVVLALALRRDLTS